MSVRRIQVLVAVLAVVIISSMGLHFWKTGEKSPALVAKKTVILPGAPENLSETMVKAAELFQQNRIDESLQLYQKALEKNSDNARLHNDIGLILIKKGQHADSEKHLLLAAELDPECAECQNNLGYLKTLQGESTDAEEYFKKAIDLNGQYADPYFNLGVLYEKNGDIGNALGAYQKFTVASPDKSSVVFLQVENRILVLTGR